MEFGVLFYLAAVPAILITGISKGGFGGMGAVSVPILSLVILPTTAAAIMLPILCMMDLIGVWHYRGKWHKLNMRILIAGATIGIAIGWATFHFMDPEKIRILIGAIAVTFSLRYWFSSMTRERPPTQPDIVKGGFWGAVGGFTSFVSHAGSPPVVVYLLPQRLHKTTYQATSVILFMAINYLKLGPYYFLGQFSTNNLTTSATLIPLAFAGMFLGIWLHHRVPEIWFYRIAYALLFLVGLKLLYDGGLAIIG